MGHAVTTHKIEIARQAYEAARAEARKALFRNIKADLPKAVHEYEQSMADANAILNLAFTEALKEGGSEPIRVVVRQEN